MLHLERSIQPIATLDQRFVATYNVPAATRSSSVEFLQRMCAPFNPTFLLLFSQIVRDPKGATFRDAESDRGESCSHCPTQLDVMPSTSCTSSGVILGVFLDQRLRFYYVFCTLAVTGYP